MSRAVLAIALAVSLVAIAIGLAAGFLGEAEEREPPVRDLISELAAHQRVTLLAADVGAEELEEPELRRLAWHKSVTARTRIAALGTLHEQSFGEPLGDESASSGSVVEAAVAPVGDSDAAWLEAMITLETGAIALAERLMNEEDDPVVTELAESIISDAERDLDRLRAWERSVADG